ncbi:MAG: Inner membrane protein YnjF [Chlamydiae bacterium]|nr:Inner membrane protein YnjF [Chlamydiota bacterium]
MIDSKYRGTYQKLVIEPILKRSWMQSADPLLLTLSGLFFGLLIPFFLYIGCTLIAFSCLVISGFFDTLDGSVARHLDQTSDPGAVLDITCDRLVEFAVVIGLFLVAPQERGLLCLLILGSILFCITTFLVVGIFSQKKDDKSFFYSPGVIERVEAFAFFAAMIVAPQAFALLAISFILLVFLTGVLRIKQFMNLSQ